MRRKELINKNVISAMSIGLAAAMAVMSPIATLADEANPGSGESGNNEGEQSTQEPGVADAAIKAAENLEQAVIVVSENGTEYDAETTYEEAVNDIIEGEQNADLTNASDSLKADSEDLVKKAEEAKKATITVTNAEGNNEEVLIFTPDEKEVIDEVKNDLAVVNSADANANKASNDALESFVLATKSVENVENTFFDQGNPGDADYVAGAFTQASELVDQINNASNAAEAKAAYDKLNTLTNNTADYVNLQVAAFNGMIEKYNAAIITLEEEDKKFNEALGQAGADVNGLKANLDKAQKEVDILQTAIDHIDGETDAERISGYTPATKADWTQQRNEMKSLADYYVKEVLGVKDATRIGTTGKIAGFDSQNGNYVKLTYKSEDKWHTIYLNYNRSDRKVYSDDQWKELGNKVDDIIIFQKSELEVAADSYLKEYYTNQGAYVDGTKEDNKSVAKFKKYQYIDEKTGKPKTDEKAYKADVNSGMYDVFVFEYSDGSRVFRVKEELEEDIRTGCIIEDDGTYRLLTPRDASVPFGEAPFGRKVTQTTINDYDLTTAVNATKDSVTKYVELSGEDVARYAEYEAKIKAADKEIKEASEKVDTLNGEIEKIQSKYLKDDEKNVWYGNRLGYAASSFKLDKTIDGIVSDLAADLTAEQIAELRGCETVGQAINVMNGWVKDLKTRMEVASSNLTEFTQMRDEFTETYGDKPSSGDVTPGDAGDVTPGGGTTPGTAGGEDTTGGLTYTLPTTANVGNIQLQNAAGQQQGVLGLNRSRTVRGSRVASNEGTELTEKSAAVTTNNSSTKKLDEKPVATTDATKDKFVTINGTQTALSGTIGEEETKGISWLWLLIIAALGTTGYAMYKKAQENQAAAEAAKNASKQSDNIIK